MYGQLPIELGFIDLDTSEMMFWLNTPIKLPGSKIVLPDNLNKFEPLIDMVMDDLGEEANNRYMYLTAKTTFVKANTSQNREGWHSDGFLTDDLNYIWYDSVPTVFFKPITSLKLSNDHLKSLEEMSLQCENGSCIRYPVKTLLKLNQYVIHRTDNHSFDALRSFVKVSVSKNKYNMIGNSINHNLSLECEYVKRSINRNIQSSDETLLYKEAK